MSRHDDQVRLKDMLDYAKQAAEAIAGKSRQDLDTDNTLRLALERAVEVIGEAANHLSDELKSKAMDIPWQQIIGMRNRLTHGYMAVDHDILWDVVSVQLPVLINHLQRLLND